MNPAETLVMIDRDGKVHQGAYHIERDFITVSYGTSQIVTLLGKTPPATLAQMILRVLVAGKSKEVAPQRLPQRERMSDDRDIYRAAKLVIDQHGDGAADFALQRGQQLFDGGDKEGAATWRLILMAVVELQRERGPDEALN